MPQVLLTCVALGCVLHGAPVLAFARCVFRLCGPQLEAQPRPRSPRAATSPKRAAAARMVGRGGGWEVGEHDRLTREEGGAGEED